LRKKDFENSINYKIQKTPVMKKLVLLMMAVVLALTGVNAQVPVSPLNEGMKLMRYEKNKSALAFFKDAYEKNAKDPETIFWYGQAILSQNGAGAPDQAFINETKALYQKAANELGNNAWILVGTAHVQLLELGEKADINAIKQTLEVAITTTLNTKGKFKGKPNQEIVNAIGYIHSEIPSNVGDHQYAIDKLKETISAYEGTPVLPSMYVNLGINYLKLGGENGGEAVTAFLEATNKDPLNAYPYYRIGKVYQSQNNLESFDEYFKKSLTVDAKFPPTYFALYQYYADKNTETAKSNLDLFLQYADKDPALDIFNADYLFRAGQYDASLAKVKELEASIGIKTLPRLGVLLAYNYDRKGDSTQAKTYIEEFINTSPADKILNTDYELAVKVLSKFRGNETILAGILDKAIAADTAKVNKLKYYKLGADMFEKSNMYADALKWNTNYFNLRGIKDEVYFYKLSSVALNAKDGPSTIDIAKQYIAAFPDKQNGYSFYVKGAKLIDTANTLGIQFQAATLQNEFFLKAAVKNVQGLVNNYYIMMGYFNEMKDLEKAIGMCDKVLELMPGEAQTLKIKESLVKNWEILKKMQGNQKPASDAPTQNMN
jgi:predicted Zn-dependent protease